VETYYCYYFISYYFIIKKKNTLFLCFHQSRSVLSGERSWGCSKTVVPMKGRVSEPCLMMPDTGELTRKLFMQKQQHTYSKGAESSIRPYQGLQYSIFFYRYFVG